MKCECPVCVEARLTDASRELECVRREARLAMLQEAREALDDAPLDGDQWSIVENVLDRLEAAERAKGGGE